MNPHFERSENQGSARRAGSYYSKEVIQHFVKPKHFGRMGKADGVGKVGNLRCGDLMELYIKVGQKDGKPIIKDIKFHTLGCAAAIATSDMISDLAIGKTIEEASKINYKDIAEGLGSLPPAKIHCANLAHQGLEAAIADYKKKSKKSK